MIWHYDEGVEFVAVKSSLSRVNRFHNHVRNIGRQRKAGPERAESSSRSMATNACPALTSFEGKTRLAGRVPFRRKVTNCRASTTSQCGSRLSYWFTLN